MDIAGRRRYGPPLPMRYDDNVDDDDDDDCHRRHHKHFHRHHLTKQETHHGDEIPERDIALFCYPSCV